MLAIAPVADAIEFAEPEGFPLRPLGVHRCLGVWGQRRGLKTGGDAP